MNEVLILLQFKISEQREKIKQFIKKMDSYLKIENISSVYKYRNYKDSRLDDIQSFVIKGNTQLDPLSVVQKMIHPSIKLVETEPVNMELLVYNNEVTLTPQLTLPYPTLLTDPIVAYCSAEVWPEFLHPVMKKSLKEINVDHSVENFDFLYQGKFLL